MNNENKRSLWEIIVDSIAYISHIEYEKRTMELDAIKAEAAELDHLLTHRR